LLSPRDAAICARLRTLAGGPLARLFGIAGICVLRTAGAATGGYERRCAAQQPERSNHQRRDGQALAGTAAGLLERRRRWA